MATNKDEFEFSPDENDDLDFDGMDDPFAEEPPPKNKREAVQRSVKDGVKGFTETVTADPLKFSKDFALKALPVSLSSDVSSAMGEMSSLKDEVSSGLEDMRKNGRAIFKSIESKLPKTGFGGKLTSALGKLLDKQQESGPTAEDKDEALSAKITGSIGEILGAQKSEEDSKQLLLASINNKRSLTTIELQRQSTTYLEKIYKFHTTFMSSYMRKTLELNYRNYYLADEQLHLTKKSVESFANQFDTIVNNTALPDVVKLRSSEALQANIKQAITNKYLTNNTVLSGVSKRMRGFLGSVKDGLASAGDMADQFGGNSEFGISKSNMAGGMFGDALASYIGRNINKKFDKNSKTGEAYSLIRNFVTDPGEAFAEQAAKGGKFSGIHSSLSRFTRNSDSINTFGIERKAANEASIFDNRTQTSIVKVIPGYLSKILREVTRLSTGKDIGDTKYDITTDQFYEGKDAEKLFDKRIRKTMGRSGSSNNLNDIIKMIATYTNTKFSGKETSAIKKGILGYLLSGKSIIPSRLEANGFYDQFTPQTAAKLSKAVNAFINPVKKEDKYNNLTELTRLLKSAKTNLPSPQAILQEYYEGGGLDIAKKKGLLSTDSFTGQTSFNTDQYNKTIMEIVANERVDLTNVGTSTNTASSNTVKDKYKDTVNDVKDKVDKGVKSVRSTGVDKFDKLKSKLDKSSMVTELTSKLDTLKQSASTMTGNERKAVEKKITELNRKIHSISYTNVDTKSINSKFNNIVNEFDKVSKDITKASVVKHSKSVRSDGLNELDKLKSKLDNSSMVIEAKKQLEALEQSALTVGGDRRKAVEKKIINLRNKIDSLNSTKITKEGMEVKFRNVVSDLGKISKELSKKRNGVSNTIRGRSSNMAFGVGMESIKNYGESVIATGIDKFDELKSNISFKGFLTEAKKQLKILEQSATELSEDKANQVRKKITGLNRKIDTLGSINSVKSGMKSRVDNIVNELENISKGILPSSGSDKNMANEYRNQKEQDDLEDDTLFYRAASSPDPVGYVSDEIKRKTTSVARRMVVGGAKGLFKLTKNIVMADLKRGNKLRKMLFGGSKLKDVGSSLFGGLGKVGKSAKKIFGKVAKSSKDIYDMDRGISMSLFSQVPNIIKATVEEIVGNKDKKTGRFDTDGDGKRQGSWRDRFKLKKKKDEVTEKDVETAANEEEKSGIFSSGSILTALLGILGAGKSMLGLFKGFVPSLVAGIGGIVGGSLMKVVKVLPKLLGKGAILGGALKLGLNIGDKVNEFFGWETMSEAAKKHGGYMNLLGDAGKGLADIGGGLLDSATFGLFSDDKKKPVVNFKNNTGHSSDFETKVSSKRTPTGATGAPRILPVRPGNLLTGNNVYDYVALHNKNINLTGLNPNFYKQFLGMAKEYYELTGKKIHVNSGYRSPAEQAKLYKTLGSGKAAAPGKSMHEFGMAVDINTSDANKLDELGLMRKYGFTRPVGKETWHVEAAGAQLNLAGVKNDTTLASKYTLYGILKGGDGWGTVKRATKGTRNPKYQKDILKAKHEITDDDGGDITVPDNPVTTKPLTTGTKTNTNTLRSKQKYNNQPGLSSDAENNLDNKNAKLQNTNVHLAKDSNKQLSTMVTYLKQNISLQADMLKEMKDISHSNKIISKKDMSVTVNTPTDEKKKEEEHVEKAHVPRITLNKKRFN